MKTRNQLVVIAVLAGLGGGGWYYKDAILTGTKTQSQTRQQSAARAVPVETVKARTGSVTVTVEAVGTAGANESVTITTKIAGIVAKVSFSEGQVVRAGQVLVEFDRREALAELEAARVAVLIAKQNYERAAKLLGTQAVSQARMDELSALLSAAQARVKVQEARVQDLVITAPFNGKIGIRRVSVGAFVPPGSVLTSLDDVDPIKLSFLVPETAIGSLNPGIAVKGRTKAFPGRDFGGIVKTIDTRIDPTTRSVEARAELPNADGLLKPGLFMTVELSLARRDNTVLVPEECVIPAGSRQFVFVVKDGKALRAEVQVGQRIPGEVEILSGVTVGTELVVSGIQKIRDGSNVQAKLRAVPTS